MRCARNKAAKERGALRLKSGPGGADTVNYALLRRAADRGHVVIEELDDAGQPVPAALETPKLKSRGRERGLLDDSEDEDGDKGSLFFRDGRGAALSLPPNHHDGARRMRYVAGVFLVAAPIALDGRMDSFLFDAT